MGGGPEAPGRGVRDGRARAAPSCRARSFSPRGYGRHPPDDWPEAVDPPHHESDIDPPLEDGSEG
jgi:hypothetical protein